MAMDQISMSERRNVEVADEVVRWLKKSLREMLADVEGIDRESARKRSG
jgi:hypothetical protein